MVNSIGDKSERHHKGISKRNFKIVSYVTLIEYA